MEKIGSKIRTIRDQFNLSQDRFGKKIGLSGKTISSYENNKAKPPLRVLEKISAIYNVPIIDLPPKHKQKVEEDLEKVAELVETLRQLFKEGLSL